MSDSEVPPGPGGGPRFLHGGVPPTMAPPAVVAAPPTAMRPPERAERASDHLFEDRYARNGVSPLPHMVVALVLVVAAGAVLRWARWDSSAPGRPHTSEWWTNITALLAPGEDLGTYAYSAGRMWIALALLIVAALAVAVWIGRIGANLRQGHSPFGSFLPIATFPAWWLLPVTINATASETRSRADLLTRFLVALALLIAQFMLLRWPLLNRIWRAGRLPYDLASIVLWLPMMIPWAMLFSSTSWTLIQAGDHGALSDSSWQPTPAMSDWALWLTRASGVAIVALLVVVSARQHTGLAQDKADDAAARAR